MRRSEYQHGCESRRRRGGATVQAGPVAGHYNGGLVAGQFHPEPVAGHYNGGPVAGQFHPEPVAGHYNGGPLAGIKHPAPMS